MGFRYSVSFLPAIQATGLLILTLAGLTPAEHASLSGHTTVLEVFPHTALREHILIARIEYMLPDISSVTARSYASRISGIAPSYNSSSDYAGLSIYGQALRLL